MIRGVGIYWTLRELNPRSLPCEGSVIATRPRALWVDWCGNYFLIFAKTANRNSGLYFNEFNSVKRKGFGGHYTGIVFG